MLLNYYIKHKYPVLINHVVDTNCVADAQEIFSQITNESASYIEHAGRDFYYNVVRIFALYAPLGAFLISFFGLYSYKSWKSYQIKKFLDLEIREKSN